MRLGTPHTELRGGRAHLRGSVLLPSQGVVRLPSRPLNRPPPSSSALPARASLHTWPSWTTAYPTVRLDKLLLPSRRPGPLVSLDSPWGAPGPTSQPCTPWAEAASPSARPGPLSPRPVGEQRGAGCCPPRGPGPGTERTSAKGGDATLCPNCIFYPLRPRDMTSTSRHAQRAHQLAPAPRSLCVAQLPACP